MVNYQREPESAGNKGASRTSALFTTKQSPLIIFYLTNEYPRHNLKFIMKSRTILSTRIIKSMRELFIKSRETIRDLVDFISLLNSRDNTSQNSQNVIRSILRTVWKNTIINRLYGGMALLFATGLLLLTLGAICVHIFLRFPYGLAFFYLGSLTTLSYVFLKVLLLPLLSFLNRENLALLIEQAYPSLNNALISSIQLTKIRPHTHKVEYSEQMVSMLVDNTANQLRHLDISRVISKKFLRLSRTILIASVFIFSVICISNHSYPNKNIPLLLSFLISGKWIGPKGLAAYSVPIIGDITINYRYPLYSGLQPKTVYNTSGDIRALKGSEVQISAISDQPLVSAGIVFNDLTKIPFIIENGTTIKGALSVFENRTYVFETTDSPGMTFKDTITHTIQVDPDQFPEISISAPAKDITVNEKDAVELKYTAKDDFGLHEISLVFEQENEKKTKTLSNFSKKQFHYSGAYLWSLSELNLRPEDKIAYHVEVKDNDTISGPKVSSSKTYHLEIYSSRQKHQELVELQEALLQETLHMLSDDLTKRIDDEKCTSKDYLVMTQDSIQEHAERIIGLFTDILVGMQEDALANYSVYYSLENLKNKFRNVTDKKRTAIVQSIQTIAENHIPIPLLNELQKAQDE